MEKSLLQILIESAGYKTQSYSGRNMNGRRCLGAVVVRGKNEFAFVASLLEAALRYQEESVMQTTLNIEELEEAFRNTCTDSLGMGQIIYFPSNEFVAGE